MTYFEHKSAAERYARSRPSFHPLVMQRIRDALSLHHPVSRALDVGCGTGQSTIALQDLAQEIVGTDLSSEMLSVAPRKSGVHYVRASAEGLPFAAEAFDLITVALAFHWFDRTQFLTEARRVLGPSAWLVIYDNGFAGEMRENRQFAEWSRTSYLRRYPSPPRDRRPLAEAEAAAHGFRFEGRERYANDVGFSLDELVDYLMTQSNVIAAVEGGAERAEDVRAWLKGALAPLFVTPKSTFQFGGPITYLQKHGSA